MRPLIRIGMAHPEHASRGVQHVRAQTYPQTSAYSNLHIPNKPPLTRPKHTRTHAHVSFRYSDAAVAQAIHAAEKAGGGVVFFPPGRYNFVPPGTPNSGPVLRITSSNIVLRGSGSKPAAQGGVCVCVCVRVSGRACGFGVYICIVGGGCMCTSLCTCM